jgi:HSP20 family protein
MAEQAEQQGALTRREERGLGRLRPQSWDVSPFRAMQRMADEMERMFDDFGLRRGWLRPFSRTTGEEIWVPEVEVVQQDDQLKIRADLPGLKREDVTVDITENAVIIQGERRHEEEEEREGYYRSERSYGSFCRVIPLPEGAITDQAKATFKDGVLEITMPAPPASKGRRLEISEGNK